MSTDRAPKCPNCATALLARVAAADSPERGHALCPHCLNATSGDSNELLAREVDRALARSGA
jgi:hypothetical protein